jgi:hypothetical protein
MGSVQSPPPPPPPMPDTDQNDFKIKIPNSALHTYGGSSPPSVHKSVSQNPLHSSGHLLAQRRQALASERLRDLGNNVRPIV